HWQESIAEVFGETEQTLVAGQLVIREQSTQEPDRDLKILHLDVFVEREIIENVLLRRRGLVVHVHQDHRVERIDGRHQKWLWIPIVMSLRQWFQIVVSP